MLDIKLIREKPDFVRSRLALRGAGDEEKIDELLKFDEQRRKTLKNALSSSGLEISGQLAEKALECASIVPSRRAETLSVAEFVALSNCLGHLVEDYYVDI